jgi:hypothetical protein
MKHVKLFESWMEGDQPESLESVAQKMISMASEDPEMAEYNFQLDSDDSDVVMVVWTNPGESEIFRSSGYAENLDNPAEALPMYSLAILEIDGKVCAYTLTPEEKYYKSVVSDEEEGYDPDQVFPLDGYGDFKRALLVSLWEMN